MQHIFLSVSNSLFVSSHHDEARPSSCAYSYDGPTQSSNLLTRTSARQGSANSAQDIWKVLTMVVAGKLAQRGCGGPAARLSFRVIDGHNGQNPVASHSQRGPAVVSAAVRRSCEA